MMLSGGEIRKALENGTWCVQQDKGRNAESDVVPVTASELKINPNSVDVTLNDTFIIPSCYSLSKVMDHLGQYYYRIHNNGNHLKTLIDFENEELNVLDTFESAFNLLILPRGEYIIIEQGACILGSVREAFNNNSPIIDSNNKEHYFVSAYDGRSTIARTHLISHATAGFGDYGFDGSYTLEICSLGPNPVKLKYGMRIGQVYFNELQTFGEKPSMSYEGYDQTNCKVKPPMFGKGRI